AARAPPRPVKGDPATWVASGGTRVSKVKLAPDKPPKHIDLEGTGEMPFSTLGIYKFDGPKLVLVLAPVKLNRRPDSFASPPGAENMVFELEREPEKAGGPGGGPPAGKEPPAPGAIQGAVRVAEQHGEGQPLTGRRSTVNF